MIDYCYLTIRKWITNFVPDENPIKILTAWVRIPNLAVEYFDTNFLSKIGSKIGKVLRVDKTTAQAVRGQFTRLSVEIDLTKPLLSKFWLKGKVWRVQYEGIRLVCYKCGVAGHNDEKCPSNSPSINEEINNINDHLAQTSINTNEQAKSKPEEQENFWSWMLVKKPIRKRNPRVDKAGQVAGRPPSGGEKTAGKTTTLKEHANFSNHHAKSENILESGSRFSALENQDIVDIPPRDQNQTNTTNHAEIGDMIMEGDDSTIPTVDLGKDSQTSPSQNQKIPSFNLGKNPQQLRRPIVTKTTLRVYQEKQKISSKNPLVL
ncbi:uncharacterized protein [Spinacia oleracea]|uniref:CCHC-type domain-containing protein n=1 Tax=Spinacia oleracea TaxID=3562 RepID=A0A9R0HZF6_SPIOL|nr:uncharacterized protein LOC110779776 [Spinacia oleracea]